jgi:hypothetical protein
MRHRRDITTPCREIVLETAAEAELEDFDLVFVLVI